MPHDLEEETSQLRHRFGLLLSLSACLVMSLIVYLQTLEIQGKMKGNKIKIN
jgi:hypothetical protein